MADHSASCSAGVCFFGAIQKALGRSNRKLARTTSGRRQIRSEPATPTIVTISDTAPMSGTMPVYRSNVRVEAIGRKKAR
jgi:hypothetical protein